MNDIQLFDDDVLEVFNRDVSLLSKFREPIAKKVLTFGEVKSKYPEHRYALIDFGNPLGMWLCRDISCIENLLEIFKRLGVVAGCMDLRNDEFCESRKCVIKGFDDEY